MVHLDIPGKIQTRIALSKSDQDYVSNNTVDPLYTAKPLNGYFSEDPDEMLQIAAFHQGLH